MEQEEIKNKTIKSVIALTSRTVLIQILSTASFFILGIFLSPATIGIYGITLSVLQIFTLFTDVGLGAALIQKKEEIDEDDLRTVFTIQEILVITTVIIGLIATPIVMHMTKLNNDGVFLYQVLIITLFISSLKVIPSLLLERKLHFEKQIIPQVIESVVFNVLVVVLAIRGLQVAAFSWAFLFSALVGLPVYYIISPWKVKLKFDFSRAKRLFTYGIQYQGKSFLAVVKDNLWVIVLARLVGPSGIGYWSWAQKWSYGPYRLVVDSVTRVTFPAYSRIQHKTDVLASGLNRTIFVTSSILFPSLALLASLASTLVQIIPKYTKWEPALISLYFLCAQAAIASISNILINVLDATGKVRTTLIIMVMWIVLTWGVSLALVTQIGFTGIAISQFIVAFSVIYIVYLVKKVVNFDFLGNIIAPVFSSGILAVVVLLLSRILPKNFISLIIAGCSGIVAYCITMLLTSRPKINENLKIILKAYKTDKPI